MSGSRRLACQARSDDADDVSSMIIDALLSSRGRDVDGRRSSCRDELGILRKVPAAGA
jgi:hypothetical protein